MTGPVGFWPPDPERRHESPAGRRGRLCYSRRILTEATTDRAEHPSAAGRQSNVMAENERAADLRTRADGPSFAVLLRRYRAGLTQEELAERAGLSVRAVSDLERGVRRAPYKETVRLLAEALGLGVQERARHWTGLRAADNSPASRRQPQACATPPRQLPLPPRTLNQGATYSPWWGGHTRWR